jgi:predicted TIM-barrel fold metal-dependent hydrolase
MYAQKAGKYVFWNELSPFWDRGQSLIIYHHLNRTASVARQTEILQEKFAVKFADAGLVRYFLFRRGSCRHFWLIAQKEHALHCQSVIDQITQSEWREYFEVG